MQGKGFKVHRQVGSRALGCNSTFDGPISTAMIEPILFTEKQAREYLGDVNPWKICPPIKVGKLNRWARWALDAAVQERAGLVGGKDTKEDAYAAWRNSH